MQEEIEKKIQEKIPLIKNKTHILHFSTGVDSVACYLRLREWGIQPILIYDYFLPDIPMVDNYIDYFEKKFDVKVYKVPSVFCVQFIDNALFQLPIKARESFRNKTTDLEFYKITNDKTRKKIIEALRLRKQDVIFHKGLRYTDGQYRYMSIIRNGVLTQQNTFLPIASFKMSDIKELLDKYDCKLPIEYKWLGMSFEWVDSRNIMYIKEQCPKSYEYICSYFPLIKTQEYRTEYNNINMHNKIRLSNFKDYAIDKSLYEEW